MNLFFGASELASGRSLLLKGHGHVPLAAHVGLGARQLIERGRNNANVFLYFIVESWNRVEALLLAEVLEPEDGE